MEIILTHEQSDLDAAGSVLAAWLLDPSRIPILPKRRNRNLVSFIDDHKNFLPFLTWKDVPKGTVERIYCVDTQIIAPHKRIDGVRDVVVWDHHPHRHIFPDRDENIYETTGACTTFLVEMMQKRGNIRLSRVHATLMLMGIYEDTGFLSYGSTTSRDIRAAGWLLDNGADLDLMRHYVLQPMTEHQQLACDLLMRNCRTCSISGKQIIIASADVREISDEFSSVAHYIRDLLTPDGLILLLGTKTGIRLICRATTGDIDFGQMMKQYNGGGHSRAASGTIPLDDPENENIDPLLEKLSGEILSILPNYIRLPKTNLRHRMKYLLSGEQLALIQCVSDAAEKLDMPVYIVGGVVRDLLLDRPVMDFDIVAGGDAMLLGRQLVADHGGKLTVHSRFFTAKWEPSDGTQLDLISARSETYSAPAALPDVTPGSIEDDLHRRDFTINTLALRLDGEHRGELLDLCGGLQDLFARRIRTLHERSFIDDPTRIFRGIRFEQRFGFLFEPDTLRQLLEQLAGIADLTGQRIWHELKLFCTEPYPEKDFSRTAETGAAGWIHPGLIWSDSIEADCVRFRLAGTDPDLSENDDADMALTDSEGPLWVWFSALPLQTIAELGDRLLLSGKTLRGIESTAVLRHEFPVYKHRKHSETAFFLDQIPVSSLYCYSRFCASREEAGLIREYLMKWRFSAPVSSGRDLIRMGFGSGPVIRHILKRVRAAWIDGEVRTAEDETELLGRIRRKGLQKYGG